ncbi:MAG: hypothetical protein M1836_006456 [Candelina mexicana]|nr:MAG: hypothetical protein M1836_006456 [Candelina mexicana]
MSLLQNGGPVKIGAHKPSQNDIGLAARQRATEVVQNLRPDSQASQADTRSVNTIRGLVLDCCQQWNIGHGGSALGMAAIATALWRHHLRLDPSTPDWFDRDRFVMSNGHVGLLQYIMLHLSGYKIWTMEQLKGYCHPTALDFTNIAKTHPEIEFDGLDMSTGPLGQGVANAVGMAMANMNLRATFNKPGFEVVNSIVYCSLGDACLQEGVALEAISLAGHLKLDNLVLIYDNNGIQSDGPIDLTFHEDVNAKMRACGFYVLEIPDGNSNVTAIRTALRHARNHTGQPKFLNITTAIGFGTAVAGTCKAHQMAFGQVDIDKCKGLWGFDPKITHHVPKDVRQDWSHLRKKGAEQVSEWKQTLVRYAEEYPELALEFRAKVRGDLGRKWRQDLNRFEISDKTLPVRHSSAQVYDSLWDTVPFFGGSADLSEPNFMLKVPKQGFGFHQPGVNNVSFTGRYVHFGTREHAMIAIANGMAAYAPQAFVPITATFSMFQLYGAAAIRMSALNKVQVIHIGTHDSIAEGACGPTHQPVECINLYRSTPGINHIRPGDAEEAVGAWISALDFKGPTIIGLNRGAVPLLKGSSRHKVAQGAYVLSGHADAQLTLISTGDDLHRVVDAARILNDAEISTRVVSMPSMRLFEQQSQEYIRSVIPWDGRPIVSVEAMSTHGWARWSTASIGQNTFGTTVHADAVMGHFKLNAHGIVDRIRTYLGELNGQNAIMAGWRNI